MTNHQRVETWFRERPEFVANWSARDWAVAEAVAEQLDREQAPDPESCMVASDETGGAYYCTRQKGHDGPCAAHPA